MRKYLKPCLLAVFAAILCLLIFSASVQAASQSDLTFTLNTDGQSYCVSGCNATASGELVIPAKYNNKSVTTIGYRAFYNCTGLTGITIPDSVTDIGNYAFYSCRNLTSINIPNSVTDIGVWAFCNCTGLTGITIPDSVTAIHERAFEGCTGIQSITIPDSVTRIGESAFSGCTALESMTIPFVGEVKKTASDRNQYPFGYIFGEDYYNGSMPMRAEYYAYNDYVETTYFVPKTLKSVTVTGGNILYGAFDSCDLTNITITSNIDTISDHAFYNCTGLTGITIPGSVTTIGNSAFYICDNLETVYYSGTEEQKNSISVGSRNECLTNAKWHYEVTACKLGTKAAYRCGCCDLYYRQDGSGVNFADVSLSSWQMKSVNYAFVRELMAGKGTDANGKIKFDPNSPITREEFVQVLYNAEGKPSVSSTKVFPDVASGGWYKNAVLWAYEMGIASGMGNGNFGVGKNITRQDLALMLMKYAALKGCSLDAEEGRINQFADGNKVSSYAKTAMDWAVTNGILSGKGETGKPLSTFRLDPTGTATRAECAAMLKNFMTAFGL